MADYQPIENHGIIGDLTTAALVGMDGAIDFMCFPHFDSPTLFASLLDRNHGGAYKIAPVKEGFKCRQRYLPDTNILINSFLGEEGIAEVSAFMAMQHLGHSHNLVRRVKVVRGEITFRMTFAPRFDYGRSEHTVERKTKEVVFIPSTRKIPAVRLRSTIPLKTSGRDVMVEFTLRAGETVLFNMEEAEAESKSDNPDYLSEVFKQTINFWINWMARSKYRGRWREMVNRSALTLKLLTSLPHGSIVAAPTFGLPEQLGGSRNWDYRYTWIRDASFTLYALMRLGYTEEAGAFMRWMEERCQHLKPGKPLQVMYRIDGGTEMPEQMLKHFEGYRKSAPVRVGNAAYKQLQLDIYGELMDSVLIYDKHAEPISYDFWMNIVTLTEWVCKNWKRPDEGIWEVRGGPRPFLYSRAMCWLAIDRAMTLARQRSYPAPLVRWHKIRDEIYQDIYKNFWNPKLKAFVQYRGAQTVDAASLLLPMVKFISPKDPRWISTLKAIEQKLVVDSLIYRYDAKLAASDGMKGSEGTFSTCSFWYVECLSRAGDIHQARLVFEKALGYANHLGLYSEQLGPSGQHLGNFPQALSHIALISAAWNLNERLEAQGIVSKV